MPTTTTTQVNFRRGTASQIASSFIPSTGEIVVDLTNSRIVVGDGFTLGGFTGAKITDVNAAILNLSGYLNSITGSIGGNQAGLNALSGNLGLTGQILYNDIIGLSGLIGSSSTVGTTGSILYGYIIGLSGVTISQISQTGSILYNDLINLSGQFNANFATQSNLALTGQQSWNAANNNGINLSGNLSQTGITLINRDNSLSGQLSVYINQSGSILYNNIIGLSGQTNLLIANTGQQAWLATNNNGINLSGNLSQSGAILIAKDLAISGVLQNEINNISGSYVFTTPVISGVSQQFIQFPPTGGLGNNPLILCNLTNISGAENIIVQPSGATSSGYWAQYSNIIDASGYLLTTLATTSSLSMATNVFIISGVGGGASTGNYLPSSINCNTLIDWAASNTFYITLTGNTNFTFANSRDGQNINVSVTNTGNLFYTGIWPSGTNGVRWPYQIIPIQTSGNFTDIYTFLNITGMVYGSSTQGF